MLCYRRGPRHRVTILRQAHAIINKERLRRRSAEVELFRSSRRLFGTSNINGTVSVRLYRTSPISLTTTLLFFLNTERLLAFAGFRFGGALRFASRNLK